MSTSVIGFLALASAIVLASIYLYMDKYRDEDGRLPDISSPEGKRLRAVAVPLLAFCVIAFMPAFFGTQFHASPLLFGAAILVPLAYNFLRDKDGRK